MMFSARHSSFIFLHCIVVFSHFKDKTHTHMHHMMCRALSPSGETIYLMDILKLAECAHTFISLPQRTVSGIIFRWWKEIYCVIINLNFTYTYTLDAFVYSAGMLMLNAIAKISKEKDNNTFFFYHHWLKIFILRIRLTILRVRFPFLPMCIQEIQQFI